MIGILFHGPEVFDSGWAYRIVKAFAGMAPLRCVLAGTMGRTAAIDSGLQDIQYSGAQPSQILREIQNDVAELIFANCGKSLSSGLLHGAMVAGRANIGIPLVQIECSAGVFVEWNTGIRPEVIEILERQIGLRRHERIENTDSFWEANGRTCRRLMTAAAGDFVLVDGIVVGRATGGEIVIECEGRHVVSVRGTDIKQHGIDKLHRLGGIDLRSAKLATTRTLRRAKHTPRIIKQTGKGVAFVDHAAMHVYDRVRAVAGAVTVGDDTTAIVGDILYRFQTPLIGITDGDGDVLIENARMTPGSVVLTVREDDVFGLRVFSEVFRHRAIVEETFQEVRERIVALVGNELVSSHEF